MNALVDIKPNSTVDLTDANGNDLTEQEREIAMRIWRFFESGPLKEWQAKQNNSLDFGGNNEEEINEYEPAAGDILGGQTEAISEEVEDQGEDWEYNQKQKVHSYGKEFGVITGASAMSNENQEIEKLRKQVQELQREKAIHGFLLELNSVQTYSLPPKQAGELAAVASQVSEKDRRVILEALASVRPVTGEGSSSEEGSTVQVYSGSVPVGQRRVSGGQAYQAMKMFRDGLAPSYQKALEIVLEKGE